jgi:hypothetical protein
MNRLSGGFLCVALTASLAACLKTETTTSNTGSSLASPSPVSQTAVEPAPAKTGGGELQAGQASGSYTAKGETVELKYAYAGRAQRFGNEATVILLTDKPIPAEAVGEEIQSQKMLLDEKIRGLEYAIDKDGYWVRYHPSQYQESKGGQLGNFTIDGDTVRGSDEDSGELTDGKYSRKVKFVATLAK